jgi:FKBP-type peptidyl-prolyl cis-trans isomerase
MSIAAQFQKLKENQNCLTILFNISLLGDGGQEDRNSRRGRESELHRQTRKLETKSQEEQERQQDTNRQDTKRPPKKKNKKQKKTIPSGMALELS